MTAHENHLVLVGPPNHVNTLRQMLALSLDVPSPAGQSRHLYHPGQHDTPQPGRGPGQDRGDPAGVQIVRDFIHGSQGVLAAYLASPQAGVAEDPKAQDPLKQELSPRCGWPATTPPPSGP